MIDLIKKMIWANASEETEQTLDKMEPTPEILELLKGFEKAKRTGDIELFIRFNEDKEWFEEAKKLFEERSI